MTPEQLLRKHGLSRTAVRLSILELLAGEGRPVSGSEILAHLAVDCDKSTVYRTVSSLYEKGLLSRVIVDHEVKYALKPVHADGSGSSSDHVHFKCDRCSRVYCLRELQVRDYELPEGFTKTENQFLIIGTCRTCAEQKKTGQ
ncbi:MAG: Fur family transcriptional regulator [Bacteroidota bacterium]